MKTHEEMIAQWKKDPEFRREYDSLEEEFALFDKLLKARPSHGNQAPRCGPSLVRRGEQSTFSVCET